MISTSMSMHAATEAAPGPVRPQMRPGRPQAVEAGCESPQSGESQLPP